MSDTAVAERTDPARLSLGRVLAALGLAHESTARTLRASQRQAVAERRPDAGDGEQRAVERHFHLVALDARQVDADHVFGIALGQIRRRRPSWKRFGYRTSVERQKLGEPRHRLFDVLRGIFLRRDRRIRSVVAIRRSHSRDRCVELLHVENRFLQGTESSRSLLGSTRSSGALKQKACRATRRAFLGDARSRAVGIGEISAALARKISQLPGHEFPDQILISPACVLTST